MIKYNTSWIKITNVMQISRKISQKFFFTSLMWLACRALFFQASARSNSGVKKSDRLVCKDFKIFWNNSENRSRLNPLTPHAIDQTTSTQALDLRHAYNLKIKIKLRSDLNTLHGLKYTTIDDLRFEYSWAAHMFDLYRYPSRSTLNLSSHYRSFFSK